MNFEGLEDTVQEQDAELATLRDQVRTLRATARAACDLALPYMQGSPIPRHRDVISSLEMLRALTATELQ